MSETLQLSTVHDRPEQKQENNIDDEETSEQFQERVRSEAAVQFQTLKDEARALFGMVDGRPGVRSPREWGKMLERAGDEIGNGRFIVRFLGAERYLDAKTVAVLVTLRQSLIAELPRTTTAAVMRVDSAIIAYYNMLRVQGWIGNLALVVERELFGEAPLNEFHGETVGNALEEQLGRLTETMLPLLERSNRMMLQSLKGMG